MNSKQLWATTATVFALSALGPRSFGVWAQEEMAACPVGWGWNENSLGQDPCVMSGMLDAACRGIGSFTIPPLNSTQNYVPPQRDNVADLTCDCDTVMYSLYMACTTCQGGVIYPWTRWILQCDIVYVTEYPHDIPQDTAIPRWAFYNVTNLPGQIYNDTVARTIGRNPEALPKTISTISLGPSTSTIRALSASARTPSVVSSSSSAPVPTNTGGGSGGRNNTAAIVGGVVGGVVPLIALGLVALFVIRRRNQGARNQPPTPLPTQEASEYYKAQPTSPALRPTSAGAPYNPYYNPEDPMTFPPQIADGQSSLTFLNPLSPHGPNGHGHGQGRYSGAPEI